MRVEREREREKKGQRQEGETDRECWSLGTHMEKTDNIELSRDLFYFPAVQRR